MSPFSAGIVKISPRASTTTRLPVGEIARLVIRGVHVLPAGHHPRKVAGHGDVHHARPARLRVQLVDVARLLEDHDARSRASIDFTSKSSNEVACDNFFPFVSKAQTLATPSRSEMK